MFSEDFILSLFFFFFFGCISSLVTRSLFPAETIWADLTFWGRVKYRKKWLNLTLFVVWPLRGKKVFLTCQVFRQLISTRAKFRASAWLLFQVFLFRRDIKFNLFLSWGWDFASCTVVIAGVLYNIGHILHLVLLLLLALCIYTGHWNRAGSSHHRESSPRNLLSLRVNFSLSCLSDKNNHL